jgi:hypothetical protein
VLNHSSNGYCNSFSTSSAAAIQAEKTIKNGPRNDWTKEQVKSIYDSPILDLLFHGVTFFFSLCFNGFLYKIKMKKPFYFFLIKF